MTSAEIMTNGQGLLLSPLKVAISTSGVVPQIRTFCQTSDCALAVSLNAATDKVRDQIMCEHEVQFDGIHSNFVCRRSL
jgi:23S rRNA (adenine2503-C2)-methyltransferase